MALQHHVGIIEDDEILLGLLTRELENGGYRVTGAQNGEQGLAMIRTERPGLVLLDMLMPILDGYGVLDAMKQDGLFEQTPVIVVSNSGQPVELENLRALGAVDCLVKANMTPGEVLAKVDAFFGVKRLKPVHHTDQGQSPVHDHAESGENPVILIIEDEAFLVDLLKYKFEERNHVVEIAMSVARATEILSQKNVRLILLDIMLPDMNGFEFLTLLKKDPKLKDIPVIITSNLGQKHDIERGLALGAVEYIIKANVSPSEIITHAEEALAKSMHT